MSKHYLQCLIFNRLLLAIKFILQHMHQDVITKLKFLFLYKKTKLQSLDVNGAMIYKFKIEDVQL